VIPTSNTKVTVKVTINNKRIVTVIQLEGGMIKIEKNGPVLGITPNKAMNVV